MDFRPDRPRRLLRGRLTSDDLADEACRLYRRGRSWHLVPVGGKGKILVDGRSVRPLCLCRSMCRFASAVIV